MNNFPNYLVPENEGKFAEYNKKQQLCYLRKYVFEKMLSKEFSVPDKCLIDLQNINIGNLGEINYKIDDEIVMELQNELEKLGWVTSCAYGGTILFIYTADSIPKEIANAKFFD